MAKLVAVCRSDVYKYERRQLPLEIEDGPKMIIQFKDTCIGCEMTNIKEEDLDRFVNRFGSLTKDEITTALVVSKQDLLSLLAQMVPCVGCRRSVERLFNQLVQSGHPAIEPLTVNKSAMLSVSKNYLFDSKALYALFHYHGSKLNVMMDAIPKSKKNKRCHLHSLDNQKTKTTSNWIDTWDLLSQECREECVLIDTNSLSSTLDSYLRKHRFCSECKAKVQRAFNILVGDMDTITEKGFCSALYDGLRCCPDENHLHVLCETEYISHLIGRAEPELLGRERHAKTLDIAQEEVLTCLGLHLYERLHGISQKLKSEEQTWQILFYLGVDALKKSFEVAMERKQGISNLEFWYEELLEEERAKEQKKEQKRQKKKKKKAKSVERERDDKENIKSTETSGAANHSCADVLVVNTAITPVCNATCGKQIPCDMQSLDKQTLSTCSGNAVASLKCKGNSSSPCSMMQTSVFSSKSDCGYSSGLDVCDSCSTNSSSREGSEVSCCDCLSYHDGNPMLCAVCLTCSSDGCNKCDQSAPSQSKHNQYHTSQTSNLGMKFSLQDMLDASCSSDEEGGNVISEEDIQSFRANQVLLDSKRQQLRATLRHKFNNMCHAASCLCDVCECNEEVNKMSVQG